MLFRGRTDRHFHGFLLQFNSGRNGSNYVCTTPSYFIRFLEKSVNNFLASHIKFRCPRAYNFQLCTIFRGRTDRHFRDLFAITRVETALQLCLPNAKCCHKFFLKECVSHFLVSNIKFMCPRAQKVHLCTTLGGSSASSFSRLLCHYSGRSSAANMVVQCHDELPT
jgi:hypothetical protein